MAIKLTSVKLPSVRIVLAITIIIAVVINFIPLKGQVVYGSLRLIESDSSKLNYQMIFDALNEDYTVGNRTDPYGVYLTPVDDTDILVSIYESNTPFDEIYITAETTHSNADIFFRDRYFKNEEIEFKAVVTDICHKLNLSTDTSGFILDDADFGPAAVAGELICCTSGVIVLSVIVYGIWYYCRKKNIL